MCGRRRCAGTPSGSAPCGLGRGDSPHYRRAVLFGGHVGGGVKAAPERAAAIGANALQLFVQSPRAWRFPDHDPQVLESFPVRAREAGVEMWAVHAIYLCNLASPDDVIYEKSVSTLRSTVDAACAIDACGVVFHVGSHLGSG